MFYQCELINKNTRQEYTAWLPKKYAFFKGGLVIKNKKDGTCSDGWYVRSVGQCMTKEDAIDMERRNRRGLPSIRKQLNKRRRKK